MRNPTNPVPPITSLSQYTRLKQPLSIGDVVSVGLAITRQRWPLFCGISLRAVAWLVIPVLGITLTAVILPSMRRSPGLSVLAVVVWVVASLFCFGKYLSNAGLISRLVFNDLTQTEESVKDAARVTRSLTWSYLGASLIYGLIAIVVSFGLGIIFTLAFVVLALILGFILGMIGGTGALTSTTSPMMGSFVVIIVIVTLLLILGYFTALVWILSRFFFADVPLSVESKLGGIGTIGRSWALTEKSGLRLMTITTVGFLITLPINAIGQIVTVIPFALDLSGGASIALATTLSSLLNVIVSLGIALLTTGFWQSVKAVLYFDLLNSKEGLSLDLEN